MVAEFSRCSSYFPVLFAFAKIPGGPIPILLVLTAGVAFYFRRAQDFDRRDLFHHGTNFGN